MGGKSKQTIGYWYKYLLHYGLCRGPVDALLEMRVGDRTAWAGRATGSQQVQVNKPNLFGGETGEGGLDGSMDIMMGESTQMPNSYLIDNLGPEQSGLRGKLSVLWRGGKFGAMNPYPKAVAFKVERILEDWPDDAPWYPEKAPILVSGSINVEELGPESFGWRYKVVPTGDAADYSAAAFDDGLWSVGQSPFASVAEHPFVLEAGFPQSQGTEWPTNTNIWIRRDFHVGLVTDFQLTVFADNFVTAWINGVQVQARAGTITGPSGTIFTHVVDVPASILVTGTNQLTLLGEDLGTYSYIAMDVLVAGDNSLRAMNPAHMLYESIIARVEDGGQGEPVGLINEASFTAAADKLFDEGFGLCTTWDGEESAEEFQSRICNVIGASLSQSRVDGQYYLDLIRDDYVLESLPIISEADVIEFVEEPTNLSEAINQVQVGWFDPSAKENRVTSPLSSLGGIQAAGGVIAASFTHREIPVEGIAQRVAARYVAMKSRPLSRYTLTTNRRPYALRPGQFFRLQMASEGVADVVCLAGEIDYGELGNGRMKIVAVQDVFGLPSAVFVDPAPGVDTRIDTTPTAAAHQLAFEAPYVELAAVMSRADLAAMPDDVGYLATAAVRPSGMGLNYAIHTAADGESYVARGVGDWCPSALVVEAAAPLDTTFTLSDGSDLDQVAVGSWALWGAEIVRVDAIDENAGTLTLGRGCADTVPPSPGHAAGTRIYFAGDWVGSDGREYVDAELVHAKLLTRTTSELFPIASAAANDVTMDQRAFRPYPPGGFTINTVAYPASAIGLITVGGVGRDRELQADQLLETTAAGVGPEAGTTYTIRYFADGVLEHTESAISSLPFAYTPIGDCLLRIELEAVRDSLASWQFHSHELSYTTTAPSFLLIETGDFLLLESGDKLRLE